MSDHRDHWKATLKSVITLLNRLDPYGLEPGQADGVPWDEYSLEAYPMTSAILNERAIDAELLDSIWVKWFNEPLSARVSPREVTQLVADLRSLVPPEEGTNGARSAQMPLAR